MQRAGGSVLTTQLFFPGEPGNRRDGLFDERLLLAVTDVQDGRFGRFDFVIRTPRSRLSEGEGIGLDAGIQEPDLEAAVGDRAVLPHQLVQAVLRHDAQAVGIGVGAVAGARRARRRW